MVIFLIKFRNFFHQLETHQERQNQKPEGKRTQSKFRNDDYYTKEDIDRFNEIAELINQNTETVLDIGSWDGYFGELLKSKGKQTASVDINPKSSKVIEANISELPFKDNSFDTITALEVLEHLDDKTLKLALIEIQRIAKKQIIISVPYEEWPLSKNSGHLQFFDENRMNKLISYNSIHFVKLNKKPRPDELSSMLLNFSKIMHDLYVLLFGYKYVEKPTWLVAIYEIN